MLWSVFWLWVVLCDMLRVMVSICQYYITRKKMRTSNHHSLSIPGFLAPRVSGWTNPFFQFQWGLGGTILPKKRGDLSWSWSHYCCLYVICEGHRLVVWNIIFMTFPSYWVHVIIPTDELTPSFFRGVGRSTTNQDISTLYPHFFSWPLSGSERCHRTPGMGVFFEKKTPRIFWGHIPRWTIHP